MPAPDLRPDAVAGQARTAPAGFRDVVATDLGGYFLVARAVVPRLLAAQAGW